MINKTSISRPVESGKPFSSPGTSTSTTSGLPKVSSREPTPSLLQNCLSLHSAAKTGDAEAVLTAFLADRAAINGIDPDTGLTPLQTALASDNQSAARALITLGARVHDVQPGCPPDGVSLHAASESGNSELLRQVLDLSVRDINAMDPISGLTPLAYALRGNHLDAARMLLERGAKPGQAYKDGSVPLVDAAARNNVEAVGLLLEYHAPINQEDGRNKTALQSASGSGGMEVVELLLKSGAAWDQPGHNPLVDAVTMRQPAVVKLLLDRNIHADLADKYGMTAFSWAARMGCVEEGRILLGGGADRARPDKYSETPLMTAINAGEMAFLSLLLPAETEMLDFKNKEGNTALHLAAQRGNPDAVQLLIKAGADPDLKNRDGRTPLVLAAMQGKVQAMAALLDSQKDPMKLTADVKVMQKQAIQTGNVGVLECLVQRGMYFSANTERLRRDKPVIADLMRCAPLLHPSQANDGDDSVISPLDGSKVVAQLLDTAVRNKDADSWDKYLNRDNVSNTVSHALQSAAEDTRSVWKSLAGQGQKITPAQQKNWCAGIVADVGEAMPQKSPYAEVGLTPATQTLLETIADQQCDALAQAGVAAEQPLRAGTAALLQTCMKAVSGDQFYPIDLYKLLTVEHGMYHDVASLIVTAFSDLWPRRNSLGGVSVERAFADKVSSLKQNYKTMQSMNSSSDGVENLQTFNMLMFRQLDLLQEWIDRALSS